MRVAFSDIDELPDGPGVYIVWSAIGSMYAMAALSERPLYVGMTRRDVKVRMREHIRDSDDAVPMFESMAEVEYIHCSNNRQARAKERELQDELVPY